MAKLACLATSDSVDYSGIIDLILLVRAVQWPDL